MLPAGRDLHPISDKGKIIQSSVLMLIFPNKGKLNTCLIRRPSNMRNHGGQVAFPGGGYETGDKDLVSTALRESFEEIGTDASQLEIIGALTPLYVNVSNFIINPFIGWSAGLPQFNIDTREVDELLIVPLDRFLEQTACQIRKVKTSLGEFEAPGFYIDSWFIWGATAMIISEFNDIYRSIVKSPR